ncbi:MAG TPA: hypothetical protein EYG02_09645 [Henriciella marina]|uniref:hypothetical protein n=1 Tax=Henriciella sp. TaxID=1968823 RepID=UPI00184CC67D|nr:hypothetical protein [Henriciella sp.]HIG21495.1 hypothetical protein [Henriciella sp.]HIK65276.1 hypothetical protein [Henriciella marina]
MKKAVPLEEFVTAFGDVVGVSCTRETWLYRDLRIDDDELGWAFMEMAAAGHPIPSEFEIDPYKYLPDCGGWPFNKQCADLTLRELYAFSQFEVRS